MTGTFETTIEIDTFTRWVAVVQVILQAFVDIDDVENAINKNDFETGMWNTGKGTNTIFTVGVGWTSSKTVWTSWLGTICITFIDILANETITGETRITCAVETTMSVGTCSISRANIIETFVNVDASPGFSIKLEIITTETGDTVIHIAADFIFLADTFTFTKRSA